MNYNISFKRPEGSQPKYKKVGKTITGQYGPYMSVCIEDMEEAIAQAKTDSKLREFQGKHYFNLTMFENKDVTQGQQQHNQAKANGFQPEELDDKIPF